MHVPLTATIAERGRCGDEISQAQYYQWRGQFLVKTAKGFEHAGGPERQGRRKRENARLRSLVELALELKRSEEIIGEAWPVQQGDGV